MYRGKPIHTYVAVLDCEEHPELLAADKTVYITYTYYKGFPGRPYGDPPEPPEDAEIEILEVWDVLPDGKRERLSERFPELFQAYFGTCDGAWEDEILQAHEEDL